MRNALHRLKRFVLTPPVRKPEGAVRPGKVSPQRDVPAHIPRPPYARGLPRERVDHIVVNTEAEVDGIRAASQLAAQALDYAGSLVAPGVTTEEIDVAVFDFALRHHVYPSTVGYMGFPKAVCTSVNEVAVHGIPDDRPLRDGDIINIDITLYADGFHGDTSRTFLVGDVDERARRLVRASHESMMAGIRACGPNVPVRDVGRACGESATRAGFVSLPHFTGHGIGRHFHQPPYIIHTRNAVPGQLPVGATFTVEPVLAEGDVRVRRRARALARACAHAHTPRSRRADPDVGRRMDGRHARPRLDGAVRAHRAHHGGRGGRAHSRRQGRGRGRARGTGKRTQGRGSVDRRPRPHTRGGARAHRAVV